MIYKADSICLIHSSVDLTLAYAWPSEFIDACCSSGVKAAVASSGTALSSADKRLEISSFTDHRVEPAQKQKAIQFVHARFFG
jgi:hypothetical protein